ncbi:NADP-dependent oxidoreductase domain-containing protein [Suillus lakei]|nr:NADP-dependent oxidoreductase domain-containing protein [Suillus lakei]
MSTVQYCSLGKTGLKVSVPILRVLNEEPSIKTMKAAWDLGIDTIDTANIYSNSESERLIAKFIEKYNIAHSQIIIATMYIGLVASDPSVQSFFRPSLDKLPKYVHRCGLSRTAIFNAVHASLDRLETQYIDPLQIHRFDASVTPEETMKALHDLVQNGKVRYISASSMRCWQFAMLNAVAARNGWTNFVSMQDEYSLLYREELNDADATIINHMSQIALAWAASRVSGPIVGISSPQRLQGSIIGGIKLTPEEVAYLEEPYEPKAIYGHLAL